MSFVAAVVGGAAQAQNPSTLEFDAVSIRPAHKWGPGERNQGTSIFSDPGMLRMSVVGPSMLIEFAYQRNPDVPKDMWPVLNHTYDLIATTTTPSTIAQQRVMLQKVLLERFAFKCHIETAEGPMLALVLGPKPHLEESQGDGEFGFREIPTQGFESYQISGRSVAMADLAQYMGHFSTPIIDRTGLTGRYNFMVEVPAVFIPPLDVQVPPGQRQVGLPNEIRNDAIVKRLGLRLEAQRGPIEKLVVDRIGKPSEN